MRVSFKVLIGIAGVVTGLAWSVQGVNFTDVLQIIKQMDISLTVGVLLLTMANLLIRSFVWMFIVRPIKVVPLYQALTSYLVGVFSNLVLPFKLGDVAQGYSLSRSQELSKISVVSAVLVQRIFEVTSLMLVMVFVGVVFSFPLLLQRNTVILGLLVLFGVVVIFYAYRTREHLMRGIERIVSRISPKLGKIAANWVEQILQGIKVVNNISDVSKITCLSLLSWGVQISMVRLTAEALQISIDIVASAVVLLVINLGLVIPLAPGNIGTFQFFSILALSIFSVPKSKALTFSVIFQLIQGIPVIIGGSYSLFQEIICSKYSVSSDVSNKNGIMSNRDM